MNNKLEGMQKCDPIRSYPSNLYGATEIKKGEVCPGLN
jgi:hypothetical protein